MATEAMRMTDRIPAVGAVIRQRPQKQHTHFCECGKHMFAFMYYPGQSCSYMATCSNCSSVYRFTRVAAPLGKNDLARVEKVVQS